MANLKVNTRVTAPATVEVALVRADVMHVSHTFRAFFEVFLSLTSTLIGYLLSLQTPVPFHWVALVICCCLTAAFFVLSVRKRQEARVAT